MKKGFRIQDSGFRVLDGCHRSLTVAALMLSIFFMGESRFAQAQEAPTGNRWAILLSGISGDPELQQEFLKSLRDLHASLVGPLQFQKDHVFVLFDDPAKDPALIGRKSTREELAAVCREISSRVGKTDLVFVFLMGHGNFDAKSYKLNLPGNPDPTGDELALMLYSIPAQRFVVVNTTTCSGGSIQALAGKGKIVVSATKSGQEKNKTHLAQHFVDAFKNGSADVDKNGRVSVLEAFTYAAAKVEAFYTAQDALQTEHPVLDDDGDGLAQAKPSPDNGEGLLARTTFLDAGSPLLSQGKMSAEERALVTEAQEVEKQVEALRYAKSEMSPADYEQKLEVLLLRLATINAKLRKNK